MRSIFYPCDFCKYNSPSSMDGKPCTMCPAEAVELSTKIEPLRDIEQRIFLVAMSREEKVCKEVDSKYTGEPSDVNLVKVCREIIRKVKGVLWT